MVEAIAKRRSPLQSSLLLASYFVITRYMTVGTAAVTPVEEK